jgi:hypothetical protein
MDSGIQAWYLNTRHVANSGELLDTQCFFKHCFSILFRAVHQHKENTLLHVRINISAKNSSRSDWGSNPRPTATPLSTKYQRTKLDFWLWSILPAYKPKIVNYI